MVVLSTMFPEEDGSSTRRNQDIKRARGWSRLRMGAR
jgi:hypothetical protein